MVNSSSHGRENENLKHIFLRETGIKLSWSFRTIKISAWFSLEYIPDVNAADNEHRAESQASRKRRRRLSAGVSPCPLPRPQRLRTRKGKSGLPCPCLHQHSPTELTLLFPKNAGIPWGPLSLGPLTLQPLVLDHCRRTRASVDSNPSPYFCFLPCAQHQAQGHPHAQP